MIGPDIIAVEDDTDFGKIIEINLNCFGMRLRERISWMSVLRSNIDNRFGGVVPKVITLDNDIHGGSVENAGIISRLKKEFPNIKLVGLSCCPLKGVDVDLTKMNVRELPKTIKQLVN